MNGVLSAFLISFGVIFVAELGDKSQLMALTFATRYRAWPVIIGITIATSVVHLASVALGFGLGEAIPTGWIALVAALAFLVFGAWTLRGDTLTEDEKQKAGRTARSALIAVTVAFFLAELGDKTMLATVTLAAQHQWFGVWLGSTLGMVAADALAIVIGRALGKRLPERTIRYGASIGFFGFGVVLLWDAIAELSGRNPWTVVSDSLNHHTGAWIAVGLMIVAIIAIAVGRRWARDGSRRSAAPAGRASWWSRALLGVALLLGLVAPVLVAFDVIEPIAWFSSPGWIVTGVGLVLLGLALVLAALLQMGSARRRNGRDLALTSSGLYAKVRNPAFTGMVVAMAGALVMAPTALGVLATVLTVVAVQIQTRAVREPGLTEALGEEYASYVARTGRFLPRVRTPHPERTASRT
jgi:Ca2+/H+ antiporter, TMEM165/GDT1 family